MKSKKSSENSSKLKYMVLFIIVIFIVSLTYFIIDYNLRLKPLLKDSSGKNILDLLDFSPSSKVYLGNSSSEITIVSYLGYGCVVCNDFESSIYPEIKKYVDEGRVRYARKPFFLLNDINEKSARYYTSALMICAEEYYTDKYWEFDNLLKKSTENDFNDIPNLIKSYDTLNFCFEGIEEQMKYIAKQNKIYGIFSEPVLYIGINGKQNTVLTGIPTSERLREIIRDKEILLGIPNQPENTV